MQRAEYGWSADKTRRGGGLMTRANTMGVETHVTSGDNTQTCGDTCLLKGMAWPAQFKQKREKTRGVTLAWWLMAGTNGVRGK